MPLFATILLVFGLASRGFAQESFTKGVGERVTIPPDFVADEDKSVMTVTWKHGSDAIVMGIRNETMYFLDYEIRAVLNDDYSLTLDRLELTDSGVYYFEAFTTDGSETRERSLQVLASPDVSARAMPVLDNGDGAKAVLAKCFAIGGSPPYTIEWYENDMAIEDGARREDTPSGLNEELVDATLSLEAVPNAASDNGRKVSCVVKDALGQNTEFPVYLQVTEPTTTVPTTTMQAYPKIVRFPHSANITLIMGKKKVLTCQATGVPAPKVAWFKDDKEMKYGIGESRIQVNANDYTKAGQYRCVASNGEGTVSEELWLDVEGAPTVGGAENFPNNTEEVELKSEEEFVRLMCQSDARPRPAFRWEVEGEKLWMGKNLTELDLTTAVDVSGDLTTARVNISSRHFRGVSIGTKVTCVAENQHGSSGKHFLVSIPEIVPSNAGVVAGAIVSVIILVAIIVLIIYIALAKRQQGSMTTSPESGGPCTGWSTCCGAPAVKSKELKEEDDIVTVEHVKEVSEEGTHEEKQKLTEAEEKPANEEEKKDEVEAPKEEEEDKAEEKEAKEEPAKTKTKVGLPLQCCRGKKKKQAETEEEEPKAEEEENQETGNGDAKEVAAGGEEKETREKDRDSGKGDTLEKVIEEDEAQK